MRSLPIKRIEFFLSTLLIFVSPQNSTSTPNPRFRIFGLPGEVIVEQSGSLNSLTKYEFANFDSPNIDVYNFKLDNELAADRSDRLSLLLSSNYNRDRNTVTDSRIPSFGSLTGFGSTPILPRTGIENRKLKFNNTY